MPSCLICHRCVVGRAVHQSSVFVIIGRRRFVASSVVGHSRLVVQLSVHRLSSVVGLRRLVVGPSWSSSGVIGQSSVLVGVRPHPHRVSSISSSVVCRLPWSSSSVVLSSGVCHRPSPVVARRSLSSVVVSRLWSSVVCGHPSTVDRRPSSVVVHRSLSVVCGRPLTIVCGRPVGVRHLLSVIVRCQSSLLRRLVGQSSLRPSSSLVGLRHLVVKQSVVGRWWSLVVVGRPHRRLVAVPRERVSVVRTGLRT